jgi:hypothetical protein
MISAAGAFGNSVRQCPLSTEAGKWTGAPPAANFSAWPQSDGLHEAVLPPIFTLARHPHFARLASQQSPL